MGLESGGEDRRKRDHEADHVKKTVLAKTYTGCLWSFVVSLGGALMMWWWKCHYHPANRQLWMVPVGLILLVTPAFVWVALSVSDICNSCAEPDRDTSPAHHQELVPDP